MKNYIFQQGGVIIVSIIVPVFNVENYISESIESVINQSYRDIEVILINDGSTDNSKKICEEYCLIDKRIKLINQKNQGLSVSRNNGLKLANGEYILFLDSDDYYSDLKLIEKLLLKAKKSDNDLVLFGFKKYDDTNRRHKRKSNLININNNKVLSIDEIFRFMIVNNKPIACAWNKFIKTSVLTENNIKFKSGITGEDIDWSLRLFSKIKKIDSLNQAGYCYRVNRVGSITYRSNEMNLIDLFNTIYFWEKKASNSKYKLSKSNILSFLAFEYVILLGRKNIIKDEEILNEIKDLQYLFKYSIDKKSKLPSLIYAIFGYKLTVLTLEAYFALKEFYGR